MSKEREAYAQRTVDEPNHASQPTGQHQGSQPTGQHQGTQPTGQHQGTYPQLPTGPNHPTASSGYPTQNYSTIVQPAIVTAPIGNANLVHFAPEKKSVLEAYLLWLIFGPIGAHHLYLKRPYFAVIYFFTFGLLGCGWLIDLFRMPYLVSQVNKRTVEQPATQEKKNISDAYTLWFPFGLLGFHHFYLGNTWQGILYLFTLGGFGIGWLVDLVRIPWLVESANNMTDADREKGVCQAYLIGMSPLGILGLHHFYLNRPVTGILYFFTFGLLGVGWIADWFRMPILVKRANKEIYEGRDETRYLDDAYILWFPFGLLGTHHFYLNRPIWGALYFFTFGLMGIGWLVDACRMPCLVKEINKRQKMMTEHVPFRQGVPARGFVIAASTAGVSVTPNNPNYGGVPGYYPQQQPPQYQTGPQMGPSYQFPQAAAPVPTYMEQPPPYTASPAHPSGESRNEK